jgi:hypothetical protein
MKKTGQRKVFVDCDTWRSLSQADQNAWDKLTDGAKNKIVAYRVKKGKQLMTESPVWREAFCQLP